jgi:hypothetical protein
LIERTPRLEQSGILMARATRSILNGLVVDVSEATRIRDQALADGLPYPDFRCVEFDEPVRPHKEGGHAGAHIEHRRRNANCTLSDAR